MNELITRLFLKQPLALPGSANHLSPGQVELQQAETALVSLFVIYHFFFSFLSLFFALCHTGHNCIGNSHDPHPVFLVFLWNLLLLNNTI